MENTEIVILSVRENPDLWRTFSDYIASRWTDEAGKALYDDCISHAASSESGLPEWFVAFKDQKPVGCVGLIPNDFISRMDLMPWLCALYVEKEERGKGLAGRLIRAVKTYAREIGYRKIYLATDHTSFYEKYAGVYIGTGVHPWKETSRIYEMETGE